MMQLDVAAKAGAVGMKHTSRAQKHTGTGYKQS